MTFYISDCKLTKKDVSMFFVDFVLKLNTNNRNEVTILQKYT